MMASFVVARPSGGKESCNGKKLHGGDKVETSVDKPTPIYVMMTDLVNGFKLTRSTCQLLLDNLFQIRKGLQINPLPI